MADICRAKWDGKCDKIATHSCPTRGRPALGTTHCRKHALEFIAMLKRNAEARMKTEQEELEWCERLFAEHSAQDDSEVRS